MFLRVKTKPGSSRKSVQLVESVREGRKAGQRIVRHVGVAKTDAELEKLMELGETIKVELRCERQPSLLPQEKLVDLAIKTRREKAKAGPPVVIEETREEHRVAAGFHEACGAVYRQLGFDELLPAKRNRTARETLRHIVTARIANPESKLGTARRLESDLGVSIPVQRICRMMDRLDGKAIESMKDLAAGATRRLLSEPASVVFFDCTTHALRVGRCGRAARVRLLQERPARPDAGPACADGDVRRSADRLRGVPRIRVRRQEPDPVAGEDARARRHRDRDPRRRPGHVRRDQSQGHGGADLQYIVGARLKSFENAEGADPDLGAYQPVGGSEGLRSAEFAQGTASSSWSRKRAKKDAADRKKAVAAGPQAREAQIPRRRSPDAASAGSSSSREKPGWKSTRTKSRRPSLGRAERRRHRPDMGHSELFDRYRELWRVEESFRITKHDLKVRPVFHWKPDRVKAHIAIACMAFACVRHLACRIALRQGERMSPERIRTALAARMLDRARQRETALRAPLKTTPDMDRICRTLGRPMSRTPYWIEEADGNSPERNEM